MRIDLPSCSFKYCRYNSDCNCTAKNKRESCEFERYKNGSEKMIPKKPMGSGDRPHDWNGYWIVFFVCPVCKNEVQSESMGDEYTHNYCPNCGQALDWNFESE